MTITPGTKRLQAELRGLKDSENISTKSLDPRNKGNTKANGPGSGRTKSAASIALDAYIREHPEIGPAEIARKFGMSLDAVCTRMWRMKKDGKTGTTGFILDKGNQEE